MRDALVAAIAGANKLAGVDLYPLAPVFDSIRQDRWGQLWIYLMLFSTIVPTLLHFGFASFSLIALAPASLRQLLARLLNSEDEAEMVFAPLVVGLLLLIGLAAPFVLIAGVVWGLVTLWPALGDGYLSLFEGWARLLGAVP